MNHPPVSNCRACRYYQPEGRRGGSCQQLGVPVQANWTACPLAALAFSPNREVAIWNHKVTRTAVSLVEASPEIVTDPVSI
jgi:hypothetical protein